MAKQANLSRVAAGLLFAFMTAASPQDAIAAEQAVGTAVRTGLPPISPEMFVEAESVTLGYVRTGSPARDYQIEEGLRALSDRLTLKTSVEPQAVVAIDLEKDDYSLVPYLYWNVLSDAPSLSDEAKQKLQRYMNTGGMVTIAPDDMNNDTGGSASLGRVLEGITLKPREIATADHVLGMSFYLLKDDKCPLDEAGSLRVEATDPKLGESVSSVIIGNVDWAGLWASGDECALRLGTNMVMYAMAGNYKKDALQIKESLRLGF